MQPSKSEFNIRVSGISREFSPSRNINQQRQFHPSHSRHRKSQLEVSVGGRETIPARKVASKNELLSHPSGLLEDYYFLEKEKGS